MKTIAIIDDDEYIGNMIEEILRKEGYDVLRAYSGTEALLHLSQRMPNLIKSRHPDSKSGCLFVCIEVK